MNETEIKPKVDPKAEFRAKQSEALAKRNAEIAALKSNIGKSITHKLPTGKSGKIIGVLVSQNFGGKVSDGYIVNLGNPANDIGFSLENFNEKFTIN